MTSPAGSDESLSLWIDTTPSTDYPPLRGGIEADVAIVGAGITTLADDVQNAEGMAFAP